MGRPRKASDRRQGRGTGELKLASESAGVPACPSGMLKRTQLRWRAYWGSDVARAADPVSDLPALERLFTLYDERERASSAYRRRRMLTGSTGQPVVNPAAKLLKDFDAEIRQLEDRFGLSPKARLMLGVTLGQAARTARELAEAMGDGVEGPDPRFEVVEGTVVEDAG